MDTSGAENKGKKKNGTGDPEDQGGGGYVCVCARLILVVQVVRCTGHNKGNGIFVEASPREKEKKKDLEVRRMKK